MQNFVQNLIFEVPNPQNLQNHQKLQKSQIFKNQNIEIWNFLLKWSVAYFIPSTGARCSGSREGHRGGSGMKEAGGERGREPEGEEVEEGLPRE